MPVHHLSRPLPVLAGVLAVAGSVFAVAGCSHITPLSPDPAVSLPPPRHLGSPITEQVMHAVPPAASGRCRAGAVALVGSEPNVLRVRVVSRPVFFKKGRAGQGSTATPAAAPTRSPAPGAPGVACYRPVGRPVTIASAGVAPVTTFRHQAGPDAYGFVVAFPAADVAALTAVMRQAYDHGDALGMRVAGQLWQAPQVGRELKALRGAQINLLSRKQAFHLHRLLVPSG